MPSNIAQLLGNNVRDEVTAQVQGGLRGLGGFLVKGYLPQSWYFVTETGSAFLVVDKAGTATVHDGQAPAPDVTITWTDRAFHAAMVLRDQSQIPRADGAPDVVTHTGKGKTAFNFVRKHLGL